MVVLSCRKYRGYAVSDVSHLRNTEFVGGTVLSKLEIEIATWGSFRRGIAAVWQRTCERVWAAWNLASMLLDNFFQLHCFLFTCSRIIIFPKKKNDFSGWLLVSRNYTFNCKAAWYFVDNPVGLQYHLGKGKLIFCHSKSVCDIQFLWSCWARLPSYMLSPTGEAASFCRLLLQNSVLGYHLMSSRYCQNSDN